MFPVICKIGPFVVYSYGLMLAIAVMVCSFLLSRDVRRAGFSPAVVYDLVFWTVLSGIAGARVFFILLNLKFFMAAPLEMIMLQHGGLAWQGGLVFGALGGCGYLRHKRMPLLQMVDLVAPYVALGQAIGRVGCFLNGCCYGRPVSWGIYFPVHDAYLHPAQLYAMAGLFIVFLLLKKAQNSSLLPGSVLALYFILASLQRFVVEFFRGDHQNLYWGLSVFQLGTVFFAGVGIGLLLAVNRRIPKI